MLIPWSFVHIAGVGRIGMGKCNPFWDGRGERLRNGDISFVGGSVCSLLVSKEHREEPVKVLAFEWSPLSLLDGLSAKLWTY